MKILIILGIALITVFYFFPTLDLEISRLFYSEEKGFIYKDNFLVTFAYEVIYVLTYIIACVLLILLALKVIRPHVPFLCNCAPLPPHKALLFLLISLILAPGILVHVGFKEVWGRDRPREIVEFGGNPEKHYSPPLVINHQGEGKSFVSGHASMGFYMAAFGLLFQGKKRRTYYMLGLGFGVYIAFSRILQGAHFLSDTLFGAVITLLVVHLTYLIIFRNGPEAKKKLQRVRLR